MTIDKFLPALIAVAIILVFGFAIMVDDFATMKTCEETHSHIVCVHELNR